MRRGRTMAGILLLAGMITGCGMSTAEVSKKTEPETVTVWNYYNGSQKEAFDSLVKQFNETKGREQQIVVESVSFGTLNALVEAVEESAEGKIGSQPLPQLSAAYGDTAFDLDSRGLLVNIDKYLTEEEKAAYIEAYLEEGMFTEDGSVKILPTAKSTEVFTLNLTLWESFAEATGASIESLSTWEGIAETAERYYEWSDGKAFFGRDAIGNYILAGSSQLGHDIWQIRDGKPALDFDKETMHRLWENFYVPYIKGYYLEEGRFRSDDLQMGSIIAYVGSTTGASYTPERVIYEDGSSMDITCAVLPAPNFAGTEPKITQQGGGMVLFQSGEAKERAAVEFLKWFTQTENNLEFCIGSGYLPVRKDANTKEALEQALTKQENISETLRQSLFVGMEEVNEYDLYVTKPFASGYDARKILESTMREYARTDREAVKERLAAGVSLREAVASVNPERRFNRWYQETYEKLKEFSE